MNAEDSTQGTFVPRFDSDPAAARYETMSPHTAVERIAAVGFDRADAEHMVAEYLREGTARHGEPIGGWRVDPYDLAEIARQWEWVDHYRGETIATARERAAEDAAAWRERASKIDAERDPYGAQRAQQLAEEWQARADTDPTVSASVQASAVDGLQAEDLDTEDLTAEDADGAEQEVRREQLNRWHDTGPADADDYVVGTSSEDSAGDDAYDDGGSGWDR